MIEHSATMSAVRYVDTQQIQRDIEAQRQAELASKRGPSYFLAQGLTGSRSEVSVAVNTTPLIVPRSEVARMCAQKLSFAAYRAGSEIARELTPHGLKVIRSDGPVTRPISNKHLVHLCETTVCYIPYATKVGKGRLIVKMTNFASGVAVPTKDGIHYRDVMPMKDTAMERNAFRVLGVHTDTEGRVIGIDPRFTAKGIAWSVDNIEAITDACKLRVMR